MTKRKAAKKAVRAYVKSGKPGEAHESAFEIEHMTTGHGKPQPVEEPRYFSVMRAGRRKIYPVQTGFGYFIRSLKKAENLAQVNELVEAGIRSKEVEPIIAYLDLKVPDIARAAAVSTSTVSRWKGDTSIGLPGSNQFFRIDEVIRKGVDLFGGLKEFKYWLHNPNMALGNAVPAKLITSHIGVELVDEALDALHYGQVM